MTEPFGVSLSFGYDQDGNCNLVEDSFGDVENSLYNPAGQLLSRTMVVGSSDLRLDFTYMPDGQIATIKRYSDLAGSTLIATTTYTYDALGNVTGIHSVNASNATIDEFDYVYSAYGQLSSETDTQGGGSPVTTDYGYDLTGQLTSAGSTSYAYDPNGNPDNSGDTIGTDNEISSDGTYNYGYDAEGNETSKTNISTGDYWTYGYNNANELVSAVEKTSGNVTEEVVNYKYDVFGNRIEQDVTPYTSGVAGTTTVQRYALDGWNPALTANATGNDNWNVWADLDGSNNLETRYLQGDQVDQMLAEVGSATHWTLTDHLGSVRDVITNSVSVVDSISYNAFGEPTESSPGAGGRYLYTGREFDTETDLQYNRARYYDPGIGRWISQDPMGFGAGDSNLYRYVNNAPTEASDPSGFLEVIQPVLPDLPLPKDLPIGKLPVPGSKGTPQTRTETVFFNKIKGTITVTSWKGDSTKPVWAGVQINFKITTPGLTDPGLQYDWIQFLQITALDANGNVVQGNVLKLLPSFKTLNLPSPETHSLGETFLDNIFGKEVLYSRSTAVFAGGVTPWARSANEVSIFDEPGIPAQYAFKNNGKLNDEKVSKIVLKADSFLVYKNTKAVYHVGWQSTVTVPPLDNYPKDPNGTMRSSYIIDSNAINTIVFDEKFPDYLFKASFPFGTNTVVNSPLSLRK